MMVLVFRPFAEFRPFTCVSAMAWFCDVTCASDARFVVL